MSSTVITARIDADVSALVDRITKASGRSRAWFAARAIEDAARREAELLTFVQEGIDAAERGAVVAQDEVLVELDEMMARHRAR